MEQVLAHCSSSSADEVPLPWLQIFSTLPSGGYSVASVPVPMERKTAAGGTKAIWYGTVKGPIYSDPPASFTSAISASLGALGSSNVACDLTLIGYWAPIN